MHDVSCNLLVKLKRHEYLDQLAAWLCKALWLFFLQRNTPSARPGRLPLLRWLHVPHITAVGESGKPGPSSVAGCVVPCSGAEVARLQIWHLARLAAVKVFFSRVPWVRRPGLRSACLCMGGGLAVLQARTFVHTPQRTCMTHMRHLSCATVSCRCCAEPAVAGSCMGHHQHHQRMAGQ